MTLLDAARMGSKAEAHAYLKEVLGFPDYYGKNLDALFDCLMDLGETDIRFVNLDTPGETYFAKVLSVFREAEEENPRLRLSYDLP